MDEDDFEVSDNSLAEWWKIQDSGRILSYKHEILPKVAFECALFYIRVRCKLFFSNMTSKTKMTAIARFKDKNSINSCMHQEMIIKK